MKMIVVIALGVLIGNAAYDGMKIGVGIVITNIAIKNMAKKAEEQKRIRAKNQKEERLKQTYMAQKNRNIQVLQSLKENAKNKLNVLNHQKEKLLHRSE